MTPWYTRWLAVAGGLVALATSGCSAAAEQEVRAAVAALAADPAAACSRLAPDTAEAVAESGTDCAAVLARFTGAAAPQVEVAGESAIARFSDQVVFLARFPQGWLVTAAGCVRDDPDPAVPYDCEVEP